MSQVNIQGGVIKGIDRFEDVVTGNSRVRGRWTGMKSLSKRHEMKWIAGVQGKPGLNADLDSTDEAVRVATDKFFEIGGNSATLAH